MKASGDPPRGDRKVAAGCAPTASTGGTGSEFEGSASPTGHESREDRQHIATWNPKAGEPTGKTRGVRGGRRELIVQWVRKGLPRMLSPSKLPPPAGWTEDEVAMLAGRHRCSPEEIEHAIGRGYFGRREP